MEDQHDGEALQQSVDELESKSFNEGVEESRSKKLKSTSMSDPHGLLPEQYLVWGARGGKFSTATPKSDVDWKIYRARQVPGPGAYGAPKGAQKMQGGRISTSKPKSDVDWAVRRASKLPAPGDYDVSTSKTIGGKFSTAAPKTDLDWRIFRSAQVPGPGAYSIDKTYKLPGGRLSQSRLVSDVDWIVHRASKTPGPGAYETENATRGRNGGRFSMANPKSDVDWRLYMASRQPGPADYNPDSNYGISGGRLGSSRPKTQLEDMIRQSKQLPGPGEYDGDVTAIGKRVGRIPFQPRDPTAVPVPRHKSIPPEARGKPRPKPSDGLKSERSTADKESSVPPRPHTSQGLPNIDKSPKGGCGKAGGEKRRPRKLKTTGLRAQSMTPTQMVVPDGAARAYGLIGEGGGPRVKGAKEGAKGQSHREAKEAKKRSRKKEGKWRRGEAEAEALSTEATELFDLAMKSAEFREMMQLYTGLEDPTAIIEKYARLWTANPLYPAHAAASRNGS